MKKKLGKIKKLTNSFFIELLELLYVYQFGWKLFTFFRRLLKFILPNVIYKYLKQLASQKIESFKHKRFKT